MDTGIATVSAARCRRSGPAARGSGSSRSTRNVARNAPAQTREIPVTTTSTLVTHPADVERPRRFVAAHDVADDLLFAEELERDGLTIRPDDAGDRRLARPEHHRPVERLCIDETPRLGAVDREIDAGLDDLRALG